MAEANLMLAEKLDDPAVVGEAFNFSHARRVSVPEIVVAIRNLMGRDGIEPVVTNTARAGRPELYRDASKTWVMQFWKRRFSFHPGKKGTVDGSLDFLRECRS